MDTLNRRMNDCIRQAAGRVPPVVAAPETVEAPPARPGFPGGEAEYQAWLWGEKWTPVKPVVNHGSADGGAGRSWQPVREFDPNAWLRDTVNAKRGW